MNRSKRMARVLADRWSDGSLGMLVLAGVVAWAAVGLGGGASGALAVAAGLLLPWGLVATR